MIVFSKAVDDQVKQVKEILTVMRAVGLSVQLSKCNLCRRSDDYSSHIVRPGLLEVATINTEALKIFNETTTQTQMRPFVRLCNVYGRFVLNVARVAAPLKKMLQKSFKFELPSLNEKQSQSFEVLK